MLRKLCVAVLVLTFGGVAALALLPSHRLQADEPAEKPAAVDLVICLDVSGSMSGLINQAKSKLWDIVNEFAKAKPTPDLRVALYSYGATKYDPQTGWVRRDLEFTQDLDKVNEKLFGLTTGGGTELVARVTKAALDELAWSKDPKALKVIFVCGNESAHQDKQYTLKEIAEKAVKQGVIVNTIYCQRKEPSHIADGWRDFALMAEGRYTAINQDKTPVAIAAPQDKAIAELGAKLNDTYVFAGKEQKALAENQKKQDANAVQQGADVNIGRVVSKANGLYRFQEDLVERVQKNEKVDLSKIPDAELPECLKKIPAADREQHLKDQAQKRTAIQNQILDLNRQREAYIRQNSGPNAGQPSLDDALRGAIREQAQKKGIKLEK